MCSNLLGDFKKTGGGLMPWKGQASLVNQLYIKPGQEAKQKAKDAAAAAEQAEAERQARITGNVNNINSAFAGRESQYKDLGDALRAYLGSDLARQQAGAVRNNKFSLARSGLTGGSAAVDAGKNIAREAQQGQIGVERQAQAGEAGLRAQDEQARTQMISLAQGGNDIGDAALQTANMLQANLANARNANITQGLGDVFGNTASVIKARSDADARRKGYEAAGTYANPFSR